MITLIILIILIKLIILIELIKLFILIKLIVLISTPRCVDTIKLSTHSQLANDLEINKAVR